MGVITRNNIVTNGLVLYWDGASSLSYPSGSATWNNIVSSDYNGLPISGAMYTSFGGGSFLFDGTNTRLTSSLNTLPLNSTFEFWINRTNSVNSFNMIGGMYLPYFAFRSSNIFFFSNRYSGTQRNIQTVQTFGNNTWHNVAFVTEYTASNVTTTSKIYVNGSLAASGNFTGSQSTPTFDTFTLGSWRQNLTDAPFSGSIAIAKFYNYNLSDQEIIQNYNATKARFGLL
jgi:hypothetical protein